MAVLGVLFTVGNHLKDYPLKIPSGIYGTVSSGSSGKIYQCRVYIEPLSGMGIFAILIGILVSNTVGVPTWLKPAIQTEFYIKVGLVIMDFPYCFPILLILDFTDWGLHGS